MTVKRIPYESLGNSDLIVDAVYEGGRAGHAGDDPLGPLLGVSNQGGFRHLGRRERPDLLVVTSSMTEPDWPDALDLETGLFTYYGDNRQPGLPLHSTPRWGNQMLRDLFERLHTGRKGREEMAPVLVFRTAGTYRDVVFLGLAVPGGAGISGTEDLVAVWRHSAGERFQNYRAKFTILSVATVPRVWLDDIRSGRPVRNHAPPQWIRWSESGQPEPLRSVPTLSYRIKQEQLPENSDDAAILAAIVDAFRHRPHEFEQCAAALAEMLLQGIVSLDLTRISRDGGRDAVGTYRIGTESIGIEVEFSLEAKCYSPDNSVTVKDTSRLISRLRHRQFGILVTTSYVQAQAYKEIREDEHPVLIVCGRDIVSILKRSGFRDKAAVVDWLMTKFEQPASRRVR